MPIRVASSHSHIINSPGCNNNKQQWNKATSVIAARVLPVRTILPKDESRTEGPPRPLVRHPGIRQRNVTVVEGQPPGARSTREKNDSKSAVPPHRRGAVIVTAANRGRRPDARDIAMKNCPNARGIDAVEAPAVVTAARPVLLPSRRAPIRTVTTDDDVTARNAAVVGRRTERARKNAIVVAVVKERIITQKTDHHAV